MLHQGIVLNPNRDTRIFSYVERVSFGELVSTVVKYQTLSG